METVRPAPVPASSTSSASSTARSRLLRSVTSKLSRTRKTPTTKASDDDDAKGPNKNTKMMQQKQQQMEYLDDYAAGAASVLIARPQDKQHINMVKAKQLQQMLMIDTLRGGGGGAAKEQEAAALLNSVFDRVSAIKAAYKQIQVGQQPYNPAIIQPADLTVVEELQRISKIKHNYYRTKFLQHKQQNKVLLSEENGEGDDEGKVYYYSQQHMEEVDTNVSSSKPLEAQLRAKKNLVKAYEITAKSLEDDLSQKHEVFASLTQVLQEIEIKNEALKRRLTHPRRYVRSDSGSSSSTPPPAASISISSLHTLHLSGLDPTHFLLGLRYAVRAVRDFVGVLVREMTRSGWDLEAAASAIAPCAAAEATDLAFQSYVCMGMFSDFHLGPGFRASTNDKVEESSTASSSADRRRQCFDEFTAALTCDSAKDLARLKRPFAEFCRAKYAAIVRPQMEAAFFAGMDRRAMADAELFVAFAEMARRVWLLHWLFCSFDTEAQPYMFRAPPGARFSEVYMDSVGSSPEGGRVVGFTVVPGFRLRRTVFQCKVYLVAPPTSSSEKQAR